jgi:hypothetical protein
MPGGQLELTTMPMVYQVRHVPPQRKRAVMSYVAETTVQRIPDWSVDEAPVVATMTAVDGFATHYRVARGADGIVRLVGSVHSEVFQSAFHAREGVNDAARVAHIPMFQRTSQADGMIGLKGLGDVSGQVLSTGRQGAQAQTMQLLGSLVIVDGELHAPCPEPGWVLSVRHSGAPAYTRCIDSISASTDPRSDYSHSGTFLAFTHQLEDAIRQTSLPCDFARLRHGGSIVEHVRGSLSGDWRWRRFSEFVRKAINQDPAVTAFLTDEETALRSSLLHAHRNWPSERSELLLKAGMRFIRIIHGERAVDNAAMLDGAMALYKDMAQNPTPMPLERRLQLAGLEIAPLPHAAVDADADGPAPPPVSGMGHGR